MSSNYVLVSRFPLKNNVSTNCFSSLKSTESTRYYYCEQQGVRKDFAGKVILNQARNTVHGNKLKMCSLEKLINDKKIHIVIRGLSKMFL